MAYQIKNLVMSRHDPHRRMSSRPALARRPISIGTRLVKPGETITLSESAYERSRKSIEQYLALGVITVKRVRVFDESTGQAEPALNAPAPVLVEVEEPAPPKPKQEVPKKKLTVLEELAAAPSDAPEEFPAAAFEEVPVEPAVPTSAEEVAQEAPAVEEPAVAVVQDEPVVEDKSAAPETQDAALSAMLAKPSKRKRSAGG